MPIEVCVPPTGAPLVGRFVRLDVTTPDDAPGLFAVYSDPRCYEQGFVMMRPHTSVAETEALVAAAVAARGAHGTGRTAYTIRLVADGDLGPAGTVVGSSSLGDVDTDREHVHLCWTMYGWRWWGTPVNPEAKFLLLALTLLKSPVLNPPSIRGLNALKLIPRNAPAITMTAPR